MPYTNVNIFQEKVAKSFKKKSLGATEFYEKNYPNKNHRFFNP
jgi:hypothetical protein